jgi:trimethylamine--corrinoid protein Co-methyltransferase
MLADFSERELRHEVREATPIARSKPLRLPSSSMELIKQLHAVEIDQLRDCTEEVLETVGLRIEHPSLRRSCHAAGAATDEAGARVRFPRSLLRELLASVPASYTIRGPGGSEHIVGGASQHATAIVTDPWIVDYETQKPRRPCLDDLRRHTVIAQKLESVIAISLMDFPVTDVPEPISSITAFEEHSLYHDKHVLIYATNWERYEDWLKVVRILGGSEDLTQGRLASVAVGVLSPLSISALNAEFLLSACANNLPVIPTVCPIAGMTSPYSMAATLLQANIEAVGLAALTQILRRGHPYLYATGLSVGHMRRMHDMYYTLDKVLWKLGAVQLGKSYGFPVNAEAGGSMTWRYDQQNGAEGMLFMLAALNSGADLLTGFGSTYNAIGMSAEMMLIHSAWLAAAHYLRRGIQVDDLRMGVESMRRAGPGGSYVTDDLTLQLLREQEFFSHELFDYAGETAADSPSMLARAHQAAEQMAANPQSPHPGRVQEELRRYFRGRYRQLESGKG